MNFVKTQLFSVKNVDVLGHPHLSGGTHSFYFQFKLCGFTVKKKSNVFELKFY